MSDRVPAQSVIEKLLSEQDALRGPSRIARFFGASAIRPANASRYSSALGERMVADLLGRLPSSWRVFHSVPVGLGSADIDHILVGPQGIFTVNTKHHPGAAIWVDDSRVLVNGSPQAKYIPDAAAEARRLERTLSGRQLVDPTVSSLVTFVGNKQLTIRDAPQGVTVLDGPSLVRWLTAQPIVLTTECQDYISSVIDDPSTWRLTTEVDRESLLQRFTELGILNRQAKLTQTMWGLIGLVVGIGVASALASIAVQWML